VDRQRNLHQYVHLCFKNNHPMEHAARQQGRISDTIFLQIHPSVLDWEGVLFCPVWQTATTPLSTQWKRRAA